ncbi:MAG: hypothetical protein COB79_05840 [Zetaproteobacteria bacterium]|nr:MAG: hypothetical protein COB79_05840 [Zetaproteobacteria bacterium]
MLKYLIGLLLFFPAFGYAGEARSVNFAAFQIVDKDFEFEAIVEGKFSDFIAEMKGSQILALVHTAGAIDGDIITMQTSVLRDNDGSLGDFGVDCQLNFKDESEGEDTSYLLGGVCRIIQVGNGKNLRTVLIIPHTNIPDTAQGFEGWFMLDEDEATGIAFYANVSLEH